MWSGLRGFCVDSLVDFAGVLAKKARLLVTNQLQYLPQADKVIYIESGRVVGQGSFEKVSLIPGFASLLNEFNSKTEQQNPEEEIAMEHIQQDQMFGELNAAEGHPHAATTSSIAPQHTVNTHTLGAPVVEATVGEAFADFANPGATVQRQMLSGDTDAVEPLRHDVELARRDLAEDEAGLDIDDAVTRQASGELRRYTIDPAAGRAGGAYDTNYRDFTDPDLVGGNPGGDPSQDTGLRHRRTATTDSQRRLQLEGTSGRDPDETAESRTWGGSFRRRSAGCYCHTASQVFVRPWCYRIALLVTSRQLPESRMQHTGWRHAECTLLCMRCECYLYM